MNGLQEDYDFLLSLRIKLVIMTRQKTKRIDCEGVRSIDKFPRDNKKYLIDKRYGIYKGKHKGSK